MPEREFIVVGRILVPWGIRGKLKVKVLTDFPRRFTPGSSLFIERQRFVIETAAWQKGDAIVKFQTVDSRSDAERLKGKIVEIHHSQLEALSEGQYYHFQIIGLEVRTTNGEMLGTITGILSAGSNDNYIVEGTRGEILIPAIADVVKSVDVERGFIVIEPIPGLLELNE